MGKKGNRIRKRHRKMIEARKANLEYISLEKAGLKSSKTQEKHGLRGFASILQDSSHPATL